MIGTDFPYALLVAALALALPALLAILSAPGGAGSCRSRGIADAAPEPVARPRCHYPGRILIAPPFYRDVLFEDEGDDE